MMLNNRLKFAVRNLVAASCVAVSVFAPAPALAHGEPAYLAWRPTWDYFINNTYASFVSEVDNQFYAINTFMDEVYRYISDGQGDTGKGIIGIMEKVSDQQQKFNETNGKLNAQMNRVTAVDGAVANRVAKSMPNPRECSEIPRVMGARMAGGGGGGGRAARGGIEKVAANSGAGTATNATTQAGEVFGTHAQAKYCSTADVKFTNGASHAAFGCTAASTDMPDGDARVQSLFVPAHDFENPEKSLAANLTLTTANQTQAATDAAKTIISSFSPIGLTKDLETTPEGKIYLTKVKVFNARLSPAIQALASIGAMRSPSKTLPAELQDKWKEVAKPVYDRIFPKMELPGVPSEGEVMRFEVLRRFADFGPESWHMKLIEDDDQANLLRELNYSQALTAYLTWQTHNRIEENNAIQAVILAHLVNPMTKADMDAAAKSVYTNKK